MKHGHNENIPQGGKIMRFQKGQSGNPGGRPKMPAEIRDTAMSYALPAIEKLAAILKDKKARHSDQIKAAEILLDRGLGKPRQSISAEVSQGPDFAGMSVEDKIAALTAAKDVE